MRSPRSFLAQCLCWSWLVLPGCAQGSQDDADQTFHVEVVQPGDSGQSQAGEGGPSNTAGGGLSKAAGGLSSAAGSGQSRAAGGGSSDATEGGVSEREIVALLNAARAEHDLAPLQTHPTLTRYAAARARAVATRGSLDRLPKSDRQSSIELLRSEGYEPYFISEIYAQVSGPPQDVVSGWRYQGGDTWVDVMRPEWRHVGIGIATLDGQPLYAVVFSQPFSDHFAIETEDLSDLGNVRRELLAAVNAERAKRRLAALRPSPALNRAAQDYADLMLRTGHYAHRGPRGDTVLDRVRKYDYPVRALGENIAKGQTGVDDVMEGWMESPNHKRNILSPEYAEVGFGMASGKGPNGFDVVWVQVFGQRK